MPSKSLLALILVLPFAQQILAQSGDSSASPLGDIAKRNDASRKENTPAKAKRVFTDENMAIRRNPIPAIALQGADNTDEVLNSIHEYRANHDVEATENIVHDWFDEQNGVLSAAIEANVRQQNHNQMRMEAAQDRSTYPYGYVNDGDSSKYAERMITERWSQRAEARSQQENFQIISRVQQALMKVRFDVICRPNKTRPAAYEWFKIRTANGVNSY
jgi:hypothetical protein